MTSVKRENHYNEKSEGGYCKKWKGLLWKKGSDNSEKVKVATVKSKSQYSEKSESGYCEKWKWLLWKMKVTTLKKWKWLQWKSDSDNCVKMK